MLRQSVDTEVRLECYLGQSFHPIPSSEGKKIYSFDSGYSFSLNVFRSLIR